MARILILFSDTGGGHRSAAEAIRDALQSRCGDRHTVLLQDGILQAALPPLNRLTLKLYLPTTNYAPWGWGLLFNATNSRWGERAVSALVYLVAARGLERLLARAAPDLVLTVHPLLTRTPWREWKKLRPRAPFVTVVTDLFDAHITWFSAPADLLIVPTEGAKARGVRRGFPPERVRVVGLPVGQKFARVNRPHVNGDPAALHELRARLGLAPDRFTILIVGGGEGMGRLEEITRALANAELPIQLAVIAGRNEALRKKLEAEQWRVPVRVTGFVANMPDWMHASDLVVTKAGPGTIMETLTAGRPLLLSGYLPGQEKGNVDFVLQTGVGAFCDSAEKIAAQVRDWLTPGNDALERMSARARAEARPEAAMEIAGLLEELLTPTPPRPVEPGRGESC